MLVIGLTGSFKTGKSTVAKMLARKGARVIDADHLAHQAIERGQPGYLRVIKAFGPEVLEGKEINRRKVAALVFGNKKALNRLEKIIHPIVLGDVKRMIWSYRGKEGVVVLDVPLLFEAGFHHLTDRNIVVTANRRQQIQRAQQTLGLTKKAVEERIKAQWPLNRKIRLADIIIDNQGTKKKTQKQVNNIWQKLQQEIKK